jgi:hypothetical protein
MGLFYFENSKAWRFEGSMGSEFGTTAGCHVWMLLEIVHIKRLMYLTNRNALFDQ